MAINVNTQDFSEAEARRATIRMILKGDGGGDGNTVLLAAILEAQDEEIAQLRAALGYMGEALGTFKAAVCTAAWAVAMPDATEDIARETGPAATKEGLPMDGHYHIMLTVDARQAFADLAALDPSGYAPCEGFAPNGGSMAAVSQFGEPTSVRRRPGSSSLPPIKGARPS